MEQRRVFDTPVSTKSNSLARKLLPTHSPVVAVEVASFLERLATSSSLSLFYYTQLSCWWVLPRMHGRRVDLLLTKRNPWRYTCSIFHFSRIGLRFLFLALVDLSYWKAFPSLENKSFSLAGFSNKEEEQGLSLV